MDITVKVTCPCCKKEFTATVLPFKLLKYHAYQDHM